ncbi:MAG TPA: bifunctional methylenetetrahydrofolate dehydrogenase/methenyltetrahydrofolate cyclohydrolase FolD [Firmicutes bacterium]|nr:bifunctional methylenetetrahydrofolate dehydrogenase/methenyltetrahydrofolate cyclohydrolase FolD [Bacillota bacterium]
MGATIIDGKAIAKEIRAGLAGRVECLKQSGVSPGLAVVLVGDDPASQIYVRMKEKACRELGITFFRHCAPTAVGENYLIDLVKELNADARVHGILVQLPLPAGLNPFTIVKQISAAKDVDGFHPENVGRLCTGVGGGFIPCTPAGILKLLEISAVPISGARAVVIGRSNIVGRPTAMLLLHEHATVTICHTRTVNLAEECRRADILIAAAGSPRLVTGTWIKPGATVIDVGINRLSDGRLVGDVAFDEAAAVAGKITPVPGGVGPMTIAMLMSNTVLAAERSLASRGAVAESEA